MVEVINRPKALFELPDVKEHLQILQENSEDDRYIKTLIKASTQFAEDFQNRKLISQTVQLTFDEVITEKMKLYPSPARQIIKVSIIDENEDEIIVPETDYIFTPGPIGQFKLKNNPVVNPKIFGAFKIQYVAGYGDTSDQVPDTTKQAILLLIKHYYENRSNSEIDRTVKNIPFGATTLLGFNKIETFGRLW